MAVTKETVDSIVEFHGHMCPGLAMGIRAAEVALDELGAHSSDEEVVAIIENNLCGVDAVQFMTGCTFGKGNLVCLDHGKNAYTFVRRSDGRAVRVSSRAGGWGKDEDWDRRFARVRAGTATPDEAAGFPAMVQDWSRRILSGPIDDLYDVREVQVEAPQPARIHVSVDCAACGEATMETRIRRLDGRQLCIPCFERALAGTSPVAAPTQRRPEA